MRKNYQISLNIRKLGNIIMLIIAFIIPLTSCKKFVVVDAPQTSTSSVSAYKDDFTAASVVTGLYTQISDIYFGGGLSSTSIILDLYADNIGLYSPLTTSSYSAVFKNNIDPQYSIAYDAEYWKRTYNLLYTINDAITRLDNNTVLTPLVRARLSGEVHFLRAFCFFYLVNIYGDVPLVLTTDPEINTHIAKSSITAVYTQIESDLDIASKQLDYKYAAADIINSTGERIRPNLATVLALQARVFLYEKKYQLAEETATKIINMSDSYSFSDLSAVFQKNSTETIWALQPVSNIWTTHEGFVFLLPPSGPDGMTYPFYASESLAESFEPGDKRKTEWLGNVIVNGNSYYYPTKYKVRTGSIDPQEYTIVFRLGEQYLIRAEARNEQGNATGAIADLNALRRRSRAAATADIPNPLPDLATTLIQQQLKSIILKERRMELFTEWGHRFFDLKRAGTIDEVMTAAETIKGGTWASHKSLFPVPVSDILLNGALTQNTGYTK